MLLPEMGNSWLLGREKHPLCIPALCGTWMERQIPGYVTTAVSSPSNVTGAASNCWAPQCWALCWVWGVTRSPLFTAAPEVKPLAQVHTAPSDKALSVNWMGSCVGSRSLPSQRFPSWWLRAFVGWRPSGLMSCTPSHFYSSYSHSTSFLFFLTAFTHHHLLGRDTLNLVIRATWLPSLLGKKDDHVCLSLNIGD